MKGAKYDIPGGQERLALLLKENSHGSRLRMVGMNTVLSQLRIF